MGGMTFAFETERLRVFQTTVTSWSEAGVARTPSDGEPRRKYVACVKGDAAQAEVAHAVVWDQRQKENPTLFRLYCEWMEVVQAGQRKGYGQELYEGIERDLGGEQMEAVAVTDAGRALLRKMGRPEDALARHLAPLQGMLNIVVETVRQQGNQQMAQLFAVFQTTVNDTNRPAHERMRAVGELTAMIARAIDIPTK